MTDHHNYQRLTDRKSINGIFLFVRLFCMGINKMY